MAEDQQEYGKDFNEYQSFVFHPYNILLFLALFGISAMFLSLTVAFVYTRVQSNLPPIKLPYIFLLNTLILVGSSATMMWATKAYKRDDTKAYKQALGLTFALSLLFMIAQFFGWRALLLQDIFIASDNSASYLYLISGLHFAHVIAGLPFLGLFWWVAHKQMKEPVSVLVYFSDPEKKLRLRLLTIYWHFLDILWVYLVLFFYVNYWIQ